MEEVWEEGHNVIVDDSKGRKVMATATPTQWWRNMPHLGSWLFRSTSNGGVKERSWLVNESEEEGQWQKHNGDTKREGERSNRGDGQRASKRRRGSFQSRRRSFLRRRRIFYGGGGGCVCVGAAVAAPLRGCEAVGVAGSCEGWCGGCVAAVAAETAVAVGGGVQGEVGEWMVWMWVNGVNTSEWVSLQLGFSMFPMDFI